MEPRKSKSLRVPRHVGFIPDGNRRWAVQKGMERHEGYPAGVGPGLRLLDQCRELGVEEVTVYGFTKENAHRASTQVDGFRNACIDFGLRAMEQGAGLLAVGDTDSTVFPDQLRPWSQTRSEGDIKLNLLVNYGWQWDLLTGIENSRNNPKLSFGDFNSALPSHQISRVDLVVRWGGNSRLSGFLPVQCAYADIFVIETLWPDTQPHELMAALDWWRIQDVTLGG